MIRLKILQNHDITSSVLTEHERLKRAKRGQASPFFSILTVILCSKVQLCSDKPQKLKVQWSTLKQHYPVTFFNCLRLNWGLICISCPRLVSHLNPSQLNSTQTNCVVPFFFFSPLPAFQIETRRSPQLANLQCLFKHGCAWECSRMHVHALEWLTWTRLQVALLRCC